MQKSREEARDASALREAVATLDIPSLREDALASASWLVAQSGERVVLRS